MILHGLCRTSSKNIFFLLKTFIFVWDIFWIFDQILRFSVKLKWFFSFSGKNGAESFINFVKIQFLDPKRAKFDQKSEIGHVRTCQDLSKRTHKDPYGKSSYGPIRALWRIKIWTLYQNVLFYSFSFYSFPFLLTNLSFL